MTMNRTKRVKLNDTVEVNAGKNKKQVGKVIRVNHKENTVTVEGINLIKKHLKADPRINREAGVYQMEAPLNISNVNVYNPATKRGEKIGFKWIEENGEKRKVRIFKSDQSLVDSV